MEERICRLCIKPCHRFVKLEEGSEDHVTPLNLLLPTLVRHFIIINCYTTVSETLSGFNAQQGPCDVQCLFTVYGDIFKRVALKIEDEHEIMDKCLFCKTNTFSIKDNFVSLDSQDLDILLLNSMMQEYFPELELQVNAHFLMCSKCVQIIQNMFDRLVTWLSVQQRIQKYCQNIGFCIGGGIDLRHVISNEISDISGTIKVEADQNIKQEPCEDIGECSIKVEHETLIIPTDIEFVERNLKIECDLELEQVQEEDIKCSFEDNFKNTAASDLENNISSTSDHIQDTIERVVRGAGTYDPSEYRNKLKEKHKVYDWSLSEMPKNKSLHKRCWWTNTAVINRPVRQYYSKAELLSMISRIRVSGEKKLQCQVCQFIVKDRSDMNKHLMVHQNRSELKTFHCYNCDYKSHRKTNLVNHMNSHRDSAHRPFYQCQYCTFTAKLKRTLRRHLVVHDAGSEVPMYECYTCGFKADRKRTLVKHMEVHAKAQTIACDGGKYKVGNGRELDHRQQSETSEKAKYRCECCGYETESKMILKRHANMHRQPVRCTHCDFRTDYEVMLKRHLLSGHKIETNRQNRDVAMIKTE